MTFGMVSGSYSRAGAESGPAPEHMEIGVSKNSDELNVALHGHSVPCLSPKADEGGCWFGRSRYCFIRSAMFRQPPLTSDM